MEIIVNRGWVSVEWDRPQFFPIQSRCIFSILSGIKYQNIPIFKNDYLLPTLTICVWCTFDALATELEWTLEFQQLYYLINTLTNFTHLLDTNTYTTITTTYNTSYNSISSYNTNSKLYWHFDALSPSQLYTHFVNVYHNLHIIHP